MTNPYKAYAAILGDDPDKHIEVTPVVHDPSCIHRYAQWKIAHYEYVSMWPNYCRRCDGAGGHWYSYDPSPAGVSLSPGTMEDFEPCPDCIEHGKCPRCGNEVWTEEDWDDGGPITCPQCDWRENDPACFAPKQPECLCWEQPND